MARRLVAQDAAVVHPGGVVPGNACIVGGAHGDGVVATINDEPSAEAQANDERNDVWFPQSEVERMERKIEAERRERDFSTTFRINPEPTGRPRRHEAHDEGNMEPFAIFPEDDVDDDGMLNLVPNTGMPTGVATHPMNIYELFLVQGAPKGIARAKACELFSPHRATDEIRRLPNVPIAGGATYDLSADKDGHTFDFSKAADRRKGS